MERGAALSRQGGVGGRQWVERHGASRLHSACAHHGSLSHRAPARRFVFDGKAPTLKADELAKRSQKKSSATAELEAAKEVGGCAERGCVWTAVMMGAHWGLEGASPERGRGEEEKVVSGGGRSGGGMLAGSGACSLRPFPSIPLP